MIQQFFSLMSCAASNKNKEENTKKKENSKKLKEALSQSLKSQLMLLIILAIIITLFIVSFFAFNLKIEYDNDNLWNILWNYFNTDVFKTLLLSIAFPLALSFWDSYKKKREKQFEIEENQRKERLAKVIEEHKVKRIETVEQTFDQWNQINYLISEVRFVKLNESDIRDVQFKIASQSIALGKVIYLWSSRLPILPNVVYDLFASYTNVLYWSAWGIAYSLRKMVDTLSQEEIRQGPDYKIEINEEFKELQEALGIFQRGIVRVSFIHLSYVLKNSDQLLEYIETYFEDEQMQNEFINLIRIEIEKKFNKILEKEKKKDDINAYRENYIKYMDYPNENNKPQKFVPVPISLWWNVFKKHIKHYEIVSINDILEEMRKSTTDTTKKEIISKLYTKISDKTKDEMKKNIDNLISELLYLKLYEFLLFIDRFRRGAISYPSNILSSKEKTDVEKTIIGKLPTEEALQYMKDKGVSVSRASYLRHKNLYLRHQKKLERLYSYNKNSMNDELELRTSFKNFDKKIRQKIKKKIKISELFVSPNDKDEIYNIIDNDIKGDSKPEYENFMDLFKTQITDTNLMNIVADDVVEYIRFVGREIRLSHLLSPEDYLAPVS